VAGLIQLFRSQRLVELEGRLQTLLPRFPESGLLLGMMGAVLEMQGRDGLDFLKRARAAEPGSFDANLNLGMALRTRGMLSEAADAIAAALALQPANIAAQFNMAETCRLLGRFDEAASMLRALLASEPGHVEARVSLADALSERSLHDEAERLCREALKIAPGFVLAHFCLGNILRRQGRLGDARTAYLDAIRVEPRYPPAHDALGCILLEMGLPLEAEACHRESIRLAPNATEAQLNLGRVYEHLNRLADAEVAYREVVRIQPANVVALERLAHVLHQSGKEDEAAACLHTVLAADGQRLHARFTTALIRLPLIARTAGASIDAPRRFAEALEALADWQDKLVLPIADACALAEIPTPFLLAYRPGNHAPALSRFADIYRRFLPDESCPPPPARERVRLLVVSHHLYRHSVWDVVLRGLLKNLDRARFEVVVYHLGTHEDEETALARSLADLWRDRSSVAGPADWLAAARRDAPDVIFYPELGMASLSYFLAAHRLAPLQIASWGHPVSSGLPTIDLFLSGELIEPPDAEAHYRERLVRLPGTGCCTEVLPFSAESPVDELQTLPEGRRPRFVIAQRAIKFSPDDDRVFAEIAARVPEAVFILLRDPIASWATDRLVERLGEAFRARGADPVRQIAVIPWLSASRFLGLLEACDAYLDCPSFSGYTTAWQAVHVGIPVVTREGAFLRERLAAGLLRRIGLPETIAGSDDEYVAIAERLAAAAADAATMLARREEQRKAAGRADGDLAVVRAFEKEVLSALQAVNRAAPHAKEWR
jgi:predicted O-linked N-acetylglucosamine transferase (SPINDLY family)